jgi:formate dehydrogenase accessory protein FdhE
MKHSKYDLRIARADHLATQLPFAVEALTFFKNISQLQAQLYSEVEGVFARDRAEPVSKLRHTALISDGVLRRFPEFLTNLEKISPEPLVHSARTIRQQDSSQWRVLFEFSWHNPQLPAPPAIASEAMLARMFLQPLAECLADQRDSHAAPQQLAACPFCGEKPLVGVLRPEGDGGKRFLICSMCATEWHCGRILCPACSEQDVEKLAVYSTDEFPHVRIEACDTCRSYLKTVDLTKTGRAIPVVDELATIPLNLWAADHGYQKLQINVLGI